MLIKSQFDYYVARVTNFALTDAESKYVENKKILGSTWYYYDNPIEYKWNSLGYRMKELEEIDFNNYILFLGCSFTVGIGLHLEDTFPYKISKKLNCDYINAAMGGASIDFALNNLIHFLSAVNVMPKAIIINYPSLARTFYWSKNGKPSFYLPNLLSKDLTWTSSYREFLTNDFHYKKRFDFVRKCFHLLVKNIPFFECSTNFFMEDEDIKQKHKDIPFIPFDNTDINIIQTNYKDNINKLHLVKARDIEIENVLVAHTGLDHSENITNAFMDFWSNHANKN